VTVLLPVDGSSASLEAVRYVVNRYLHDRSLDVHLLNVRPAFSKHVAAFVSRGNQDAYHREQGEKALAAARGLLEAHGVPHAVHVEVGARAETISSMAESLGASRIVMATHPRNALRRVLEESVTHRVLELTKLPVEVVARAAA
jgi:nucleotide-binding universal stress UspA family protein